MTTKTNVPATVAPTLKIWSEFTLCLCGVAGFFST